ncbi:acyl carrier protein [Thiohalocapsa sp. ML1]|jgi:acyl carrier protein|uniref:acyl carrier protein n=1 Tax=Thiohalocapsa sp. ML1 TaxID=1431688 RepID=UPI000732386F|nr:acyl carrier protein [Thiohalocapsa sp. ML1]
MNVTAADIAALINDSGTSAHVGAGDYDRTLSDLGIDSLDVATIFLAIQERYGVSVPDAEIDAINTVNLIVARINGD